MKNKYTNKALKNNNSHFHSNNYTTGYVEIKRNNIFTILKYLFIIVTCAIITFYLLNI